MLLSDLSVKRPVFATVVNLVLVIFGIVCFSMLPLREYPDIDSPVVTITTDYPGASAEIVESKITQPLEDLISGVEGIVSINSSSRVGRSNVTIEFNVNRDIDAAANDVRERVSRMSERLPDQARPPQVVKTNADDDTIAWFLLSSEKMSNLELTDYANRYIVERFSVVDGVARLQIGGERKYAMRIWLNRDAMASRGVTVQDIETVLRNENVELPAGNVKSIDRDFIVRVVRTYKSQEDYRRLVVKKGDNYLVRLGEIADVTLASENEESEFRSDGRNVLGIGIIKQSKANTLDVVKNVRAEVDRIQPMLPEGTSIIPSYDSSVFIAESIKEVYNTLAIAMVLVVVVIYAFLGSLRATFIPAVTVPVALVAAVTVLYALDFSVNLLTLLAMVLAIGLVVDDSIVVLENIYRRIEQGQNPLLAAYHGSREVGFAVIATTLVLIAVFVPLVFMQGDLGKLFTEFALAVAAAVAFSSVTALTLTPMLSSKMLRKKSSQSRFASLIQRLMTTTEHAYRRQLSLVTVVRWPSWLVLICCLAISAVLLKKLPSELAPQEDRGTFFVMMNSAEGASYRSNSENMKLIEDVLLPYYQRGELTRLLIRVPGFGNAGGMAIVGSENWHNGQPRTQQLIQEIGAKLNQLPDIRAFTNMRGGLSGSRGGGGRPVQFVIQGNTYEELAKWRDIVLAKARENPQLQMLDHDYKETVPQILVEINTERAADLGISVGVVGRALEAMLAGRRVTTFLDRGKEYDLILEGADADFTDPTSITGVYVRSGSSNQLIPLDNLVTLREEATSSTLNRYNRMRAITISANLAPGYSLGEALEYLENVVKTEIKDVGGIDYKGESLMFKTSGESTLLIFALAMIITYLVLAAQFESFVHPFVIMLTVPLGLAGALGGLYLAGMTLNIYSQIGLVMIIGLVAKNGILIVEFANQLRDNGVAFQQAIEQAAVQRLRPITMTAFTTVMSAIPLIITSGPGSESRMVIGMVIFAGVSVATFLTLYVVPMAYVALCRNTGSPQALERELEQLEQQHGTGVPAQDK